MLSELEPQSEFSTDRRTADHTTRQRRRSWRSFLFFIITTSVLFGGVAGAFVSIILFKTSPGFLEKISYRFFRSSDEKSNEESLTPEEVQTINAVEKIANTVVNIVVYKNVTELYDMTGPGYPFPEFAPLPDETKPDTRQVGGGTGFIVSSDGLILTNKHVVRDDTAEYLVVMKDGSRHTAKVVGRDPLNDLAIIKIEGSDLPVAALGDSGSLRIGQTVMAIGNSLGEFGHSVTKGIVSGIGRHVQAGDTGGMVENIDSAIQTDAAINFGNSGGPLINTQGEIIGINTAITVEGQFIGFAIPVNIAKPAIESVQKFGKIVRPYIGIRYIIIDDTLARYYNLSQANGAYVVSGDRGPAIQPGSPAAEAGLQAGDIILELNHQLITEENTLAELVSAYTVGDEVELKILRNQEEKIIKLKLAEFPQ